MRRVSQEVGRRCTTRGWYDTRTGELCIGYTDPTGYIKIAGSYRAYRDLDRRVECKFDAVLGEETADSIVFDINQQRVPWRVKEGWMKTHKARKKHADAEHAAVASLETAKEVMRRTEHQYDKHSLGRTYRKSAVVNGFKGATA